MIEVRDIVRKALSKDLLIDLEDRLRAEARKAFELVDRDLPLNAKRSREVEGQIRFRLQEQGYEEVIQRHGGHLLSDGVLLGTNLKIFQPFARFSGAPVGVILGFASMPEPRKIPSKNQSRAAGVSLNVRLQPSIFFDERSPQPTDVFVLFLTARDRQRAGMIEEIAVGVIGSDYKDYIFYESLDSLLGGYADKPTDPEGPDEGSSSIVKLRQAHKPFVPPERRPDEDVADETAD